MKPYYEDKESGITIYHGDCREVLPSIGSVDCVVTDPPYGIGFKYNQHNDTPDGYAEMMREWIASATPLVRGSWWVWQAMLQADSWHKWFPDGFRIFAALKGFVQFRPQSVQHSWDPVIFWGSLTCDEPSVYRKDFHYQALAPFGAGRERINHPCPRPIEQVRYVLSLATQGDACVLDPFMGSGTTLRAAKDLGLSAIGIEIDERYCEIAANRLAQKVLQFN